LNTMDNPMFPAKVFFICLNTMDNPWSSLHIWVWRLKESWSILYMLLLEVPEHAYNYYCCSNWSWVICFVFSLSLGFSFDFTMLAELLLLCYQMCNAYNLNHWFISQSSEVEKVSVIMKIHGCP
jgi:hypothetical protein